MGTMQVVEQQQEGVCVGRVQEEGTVGWKYISHHMLKKMYLK